MNEAANIVSVSGGKDSAALLLLALERKANPIAVFADTGHEHPITYEYLDYLREAIGIEIRVVRADFSRLMAGKRKFIEEKWPAKRVPQERIDRAMHLLVPTGNPFLDLCIWKGRFPSTKARFCTQELKSNPITEQVVLPLLKEGREIISWQGVRAEESPARALLDESEWTDPGITVYRPILRWKVAEVFAFADRYGIKPNPLYTQGMGRVGCMPCIMCRKDELLEISKRFPEEIARVKEWEALVSEASKRGDSTFFANPGEENISHLTHGIDRFVQWSRTSRGGRQDDLLRIEQPAELCASLYGLCE